MLESNGEEVYQLISYPTLLVIAKVILLECQSMLNLFATTPLWSVKCIATYFTILGETNGNHFEMFKDILKKGMLHSVVCNVRTHDNIFTKLMFFISRN